MTTDYLPFIYTDSITLLVEQNPPSSPAMLTGPETLCSGMQKQIYHIDTVTDASYYHWILPYGISGISSTDSVVLDFSQEAVSGIIQVAAGNACGLSNYLSEAVTVNPCPVVFKLDTLTTCPGETLFIPIKVSQFMDIGLFNLNLDYDTNSLVFQGIEHINSAVSPLTMEESTSALLLSSTIPFGAWIPDGDTLLVLKFSYAGGNTSLNWVSGQCQVLSSCGTSLDLNLNNGLLMEGNPLTSLNGQVSFAGSNIPLQGLLLQLSQDEHSAISDTTDLNGNYQFTGLCPGEYTLTIQSSLPWGGVNSIDALLVLKYFVGVTQLTPMQLLAADVDASGYVNSTDALQIARRFTGIISSFPAGDWVFETATISIPQPGNYQQNLQGLCTGDINTSFLPGYNAFQVCGDTFTDLRNGKKYPTVQIGNQCWFAKNLNIGTNLAYNGIPTHNGIIEKFCRGDQESNCELWGAFYSWDELMQYQNVPGSQGICPNGFHVPSREEFCALFNILGDSTVAGGKMKESGYTHWNQPNTGATNQSGFTALGSGSMSGVQFLQALITTSTEDTNEPDFAYAILLSNTSAEVNMLLGPKSGFVFRTVRCIQD